MSCIQKTYRQTNLVSDIPGSAAKTDPDVINAWGIVAVDGGFWVLLNGTNMLKWYDNLGNLIKAYSTPPGATNGPTGLAKVPVQHIGGPEFVFVTEGGVLGSFVPSLLNPVVVNQTDATSVYKGVAILGNFIYVANFNKGRVDVFNLSDFTPVPAAAIVDAGLAAANYNPFNVYSDGKDLFITYALFDTVDMRDNINGPGNGYLSVWTGGVLRRLANRGPLNAPWGMLRVCSKLYVGNFGDGVINVFDITKNYGDCNDPICRCKCMSAEFCESLKNKCGSPIQIDGLWGITNWNGGATITFAAGSQDEEHGLIGVLTPNLHAEAGVFYPSASPCSQL
jgi:uncharacterized protein (TIGR03118 family)